VYNGDVPVFGDQRVEGWDGSKAKDDFLSVLATGGKKRLAKARQLDHRAKHA
jgi:hypothetical protein